MNPHDFSPIQNWLLVDPIQSGENTPGGLVVPSVAQDDPTAGFVVAAGPGTDVNGNEAPMPEEGDCVLFAEFVGDEVDIDGRTHLMMRSNDVMATVDPELV